MVGSVTSTTVTFWLQLSLLPASSSAYHLITVSPSGKLPVTLLSFKVKAALVSRRTAVNATELSQLSETLGAATVTSAVQSALAFAETGSPHVIVGLTLSTTVTV